MYLPVVIACVAIPSAILIVSLVSRALGGPGPGANKAPELGLHADAYNEDQIRSEQDALRGMQHQPICTADSLLEPYADMNGLPPELAAVVLGDMASHTNHLGSTNAALFD